MEDKQGVVERGYYSTLKGIREVTVLILGWEFEYISAPFGLQLTLNKGKNKHT